MKNTSIKKNYLLQSVYYILNLFLSLMTSPLITRRLGDTALGTYTYVSSITYYFTLIANLGILRYGQRVISIARKDPDKLRKTFWSLYRCHFLISVTSVILYALFIFLFIRIDQLIYWINLVFVISSIFDLTWLFYGLEDFSIVIIVNLIERFVILFGILFFVHTPQDLWIYTLLETGILLIGNLCLMIRAKRVVPFIQTEYTDCIAHLKPLLILSGSMFAVAIYTVFDKTLLGLLSTKENVAYYEYSNKIINIPKNFISIICSVIYPRACDLANRGDIEGQKKYSNLAFYLVCAFGFASIFGLIAIANPFSILYFGESFALCGNIIKTMTPLILLIGLGEVLRSIFLIPMNNDRLYLFMTLSSAFISLVVSYFLIPLMGVFGTIIGKIAAETCFLILLLLFFGKYTDKKNLCKIIFLFFLIGLLMYLLITILPLNSVSLLRIVLLKTIIGAFIYILLAIFGTRFFFKDIWSLFYSFVHDELLYKLKK